MAGRRGGDAPGRVQLGPYWLDFRAERGEWCIAWYDAAARTRRRRSTGVRGSEEAGPPEAAREALARHYLEAIKPAEPQAPKDVAVAELLTIWQREHVAKKADAARYAISVTHLLRFFDTERRAGRVIGGVTVADVNKKLVDRFIAFRKGEHVGGHTISRDLAALRGALNHAWREERIAAAPFVRDVDAKDKAKPRDTVFTQEQVAGLLEAAYRLDDRRHVFLYSLIALSTCGRSEAILDLHSRQLRDGLIHFLDADRDQTSKRRSVVPITPTLAPWLEDARGKVIRYRVQIAEKNREPGGPVFLERDCYDLGKAFESCLIEARIARHVSEGGDLVWLPARRKLGETEPRPKMKGTGTPNTLRHTIITELHRRGVAEAQIEAAAGHIGEGTNKRNYRHLRPDYLAELIGAVEDYWREMTRLTTVHLRTQCGPTVISFASAKAGQRLKNG